MTNVTVTNPKEIDSVYSHVCPKCGCTLQTGDWECDFVTDHIEAWTSLVCEKCDSKWYMVFNYSHIEYVEED